MTAAKNIECIDLAGRHRLTRADIGAPGLNQQLIGWQTVDVLYSDPPWGDANCRYWTTINRRQTGMEYLPHSYEGLLVHLFRLVNLHVDGHVFIETGPRWAEMLEARAKECLEDVAVVPVEYRAGAKMLPSVVVYGRTERARPRPGLPEVLRGLSGYELVHRAVGETAIPEGVVLDPCCGKGYTARAAIAHGMRFFGNDFNAKRLAETARVLVESL